MIIENIETMHQFEGNSIEFFIDDSNSIGEVYLDGDLIFQTDDVIDEDHLESEFYNIFTIIHQDSKEEWESEFDEEDMWS